MPHEPSSAQPRARLKSRSAEQAAIAQAVTSTTIFLGITEGFIGPFTKRTLLDTYGSIGGREELRLLGLPYLPAEAGN